MGWLKYGGITLVILVIGLGFLLFKQDLPADLVDAKYSNAQSRFLTLPNGSRIHYRDEGKRSDTRAEVPSMTPVLVLLHGSNASLHTWEPWVKLLGDEYRIISMDLPGHGLTGLVPDGEYDSKAQVSTVNAVVSYLGVTSFVLGGNSMGGGVTWRYALEYPEKVEAMILVDASGLPQWWAARQKTNQNSDRESPLAFKLLAEPWFRAIARYLDPYQLVVQGLKSAYNHSPVVNQALIDRYYDLSLRAGTRDATMARFSGFGPRQNQTPVDLSQLQQPTLVMWGREDALIPVDLAYQFAEALPNAELIIYDKVGHIPMEEIPEKSAMDVLTFLKGLNLRQETPITSPVLETPETPLSAPKTAENGRIEGA